ncbi:acyl dehydratase [Gemmatimonadota bacterium]
MAATIPNWETMELPLSIPETTVVPDHRQIFMFSAATWNRHHIHYSKDAAVQEGFADVVVQRGLLGNFLARMLTDWIGDGADVRRLSWRVLRSALPGQRLRCEGEIVAKREDGEARYLDCDVRTVNGDGEMVVSGTAVLKMRLQEE